MSAKIGFVSEEDRRTRISVTADFTILTALTWVLVCKASIEAKDLSSRGHRVRSREEFFLDGSEGVGECR